MRATCALLFIILLSACEFTAPIVEWEDGYIPYYLTGPFNEKDINTIESSMDTWEASCGVKFEEVLPRSGAYNIIRVRSSNDWASSIGENNVRSHMYYGDGYEAYGHCLHELGHCLGLLHEHQRPDRNLYITIDYSNILPEYAFNFDIQDNPLFREQDFAYDYNSIMHYYTTAFSINGDETIIPNPPHVIGRSDRLTETDIAKAQAIYGPPRED